MGLFVGMGDGKAPHEMIEDENDNEGANNLEMTQAMLQYSPIRSMIGFMGLEEEKMEALLAVRNQ